MNINRTELIEAIEKRIAELKITNENAFKRAHSYSLPEEIRESERALLHRTSARLHEAKEIFKLINSLPTTEPKLPTVEEIRLVLLDWFPHNEETFNGASKAVLTLLESLTKQPE